jgi:hypothetical protein
MPMASLSRWTMSYFAAALACLLLAEAMMAGGVGYPFASLADPSTLILVHVVAIGWLSLSMAGALLQFVPVLVARPLAFPRLALPALLLIGVGLAVLCSGFGAVAGVVALPAELLPVAGLLLLAGFACLLLMLGGTMAQLRPATLFSRFVMVGLASLAATVLSGLAFAFILSGRLDGAAAGALLPGGPSFHAALGLGGWLSLTAFGVSYKLFAMFMMAPEHQRRSTPFVLACATVSLTLACGALIVLAGGGSAGGLLVLVVTGLAVATLLYTADIVVLYRARRRKALEINMLASMAAFATLVLCAGLAPLLDVFDGPALRTPALLFALAFGWLSGLTLAQMVKIVSFMTWLEAYGPVLGRMAAPRVSDLVDPRRAGGWFVLYYLAVGLGITGLALGAGQIFRAAGLLGLVATFGIVFEFVRIRRLAEIAPEQRPPAARRNLFLPQPEERTLVHDPSRAGFHPGA